MQCDDYFRPMPIVANSITTGYGAAVNDVLTPLKVIRNLLPRVVQGWNMAVGRLKSPSEGWVRGKIGGLQIQIEATD
jgi:hypothetical protein